MNILKFYVQHQTGYDIYCYPTAQLKSGGFTGIVFNEADRGNKAKLHSLRNWYPAPVAIDRDDVPPKIVEAIETKLARSGFRNR